MADELSHEEFGFLYLSQASNYTYSFHFSEAHVEVQRMIPTSPGLSRKQANLLWDQVFCVGRIFRGRAAF